MNLKSSTAKCLTFFLILLPSLGFAQDGGSPDTDGSGGNGTLDTPIDSWLFILLIIGVLYGLLKYKRQRKLN
jgi:hypothetical protein